MSKPAPAALKDFLRSNRTSVVAVLLALATLIVYCRVAGFNFTNYDDQVLVYENPIVSGGLSMQNALWALRTTYFDFWHPMSWWSHMLDCELFGLTPGLHHLVSLSFHTANSLLLFGLLLRMTGAWKRSAVAAALFALHPAHVESVAWIAERKDVLSTFFFLLTLHAYIRWQSRVEARESKAGEAKPSGGSIPLSRPTGEGRGEGAFNLYLAALLFFTLALMSKAMVVTLPFVLLLLDYWPLGRLSVFGRRVAHSSSANVPATSPGRLIFEKLPFFLLSFISCVITYSGMRSLHNVFSPQQIPWSFRWTNALISYVRYLWKLIWPTNLVVFYPSPTHWTAAQVGGAILVLGLISIVAVVLIRSAPYLAVGWALFLGTLVPVIGLVAMSHQSIADRYTYIPSIGLFVAVVWGAADLSARFHWRPAFQAAMAGIVLVLCGGLTWAQTAHWRDSFSLWTHCLAVNPSNATARFGYACALRDAHRNPEAMAQYLDTLRLEPDHLEANLNLGCEYYNIGNLNEATNCFATALRIKPDYFKAHTDMGTALYHLKDYADASNHYARAIALRPGIGDTYPRYASALLALSNYNGAIAACDEGTSLDPKNASAYTWKGEALSALGKSDDAMKCYYAALDLNNDDAEAHYALGLEWLQRSNFDEALSGFKDALRLEPDRQDARSALARARLGSDRATIAERREAIRSNPDAPVELNNLAWLLATCPEAELRNGAEAVILAERACRATSFQQPTMVGTLAAAYAEAGKFDQAIRTAQKACDLATSLGRTDVLNRNQELMQRYQRHEAYHEGE